MSRRHSSRLPRGAGQPRLGLSLHPRHRDGEVTKMAAYIVRGLFLAVAFGVVVQAAISWWEPELTVIRSSHLHQQPLAQSSPNAAQQERRRTDPQGLLMLYQLVHGMRS